MTPGSSESAANGDPRRTEAEVVGLHAAEGVVVDLDPAEAPSLGEHLRLGLDHLGDEHAADLAERRVELQTFDVAGELFDAVDVAASLDLDRDDCVRLVAAHQVDRPDRRGVLAPHQGETILDGVRAGGEQLLQVCFDAVLLQARVLAELGRHVADHLVQVDRQGLLLRVGHHPVVAVVDERVRSVHPVERLVGAAVGMDRHTAIGLHHDQPGGLGQVGVESTGVVDGTASDHQTHGRRRYLLSFGRSASTCSRMRFWISSRRSCSSR